MACTQVSRGGTQESSGRFQEVGVYGGYPQSKPLCSVYCRECDEAEAIPVICCSGLPLAGYLISSKLTNRGLDRLLLWMCLGGLDVRWSYVLRALLEKSLCICFGLSVWLDIYSFCYFELLIKFFQS